MNDLRNEKIRRLERKVLKAGRVSAEELREIVSAPQPFDKISARIKLAQETEQAPEAAFRKQEKSSLWSLPKIGLAFGGFIVLLAGVYGLFFFPRTDFPVSQLTESVAAPEIKRQTAAVDNPGTGENEKAENSTGESVRTAKQIAFKNKFSKAERRTSGMIQSRKTIRPADIEPEEAFYPLAFAENLEEAKEAGQVIRVELTRSSLLALGVNPPTDDENLKVKTDLLIGADGVAHGIRFVK